MGKRFAIGSAVVVIAAAISTAVVLLFFLDRTAARLRCLQGSECREVAKHLTPVNPGKPQTVMILGSDVRKTDRKLGLPERADTVILIRLDPDTDRISLLSLPRDLKVYIPGKGPDKLNAAYAIGGVNLTLKVVKQLTGLEVNHVVNINFRGFKDAVNAIGCVYFDVDQRYYHSNVGLAASAQYAEIDVPPGYQKLCGQNALDFVRYRHTDGDIARGARQQAFMREARRTVGTDRLFKDRDKLIKIFAKHTTSDIRGSKDLLRLVKLVLVSARDPFHTVKLRIRLGETYVYADQPEIARAVRELLGADVRKKATTATKKRKKKRKRLNDGAATLENGRDAGIEQVAYAAPRVGFPVYYPKMRDRGSQYQGTPRTYTIRSPDNHRYRAVKMVLKTASGKYYGVMETSWRSPPIIGEPSETRKIRGRRYLLFFDQRQLRMVAFRTRHAAYWISNSIENDLTPKEMVKIAASMTNRS